MAVQDRRWGDSEYAIIHVSDLHFGSPNYRNAWGLTKSFLQEIKPDLLLVSGDLVDSPKRARYEEVKQSLDELRVPYFVCAGNHDRWYRGNRFPSWAQGFLRIISFVLFVSVGYMYFQKWDGVLWHLFLIGLIALVALGGIFRPGWWFWVLNRFAVEDCFSEVFVGRIVTHETLQSIKVPHKTVDAGGGSNSPWVIGLFGDDSNVLADASARGYIPTSHFQPIRKTTEGQDCELCLFLVHHHLLSIRRLEDSRVGRFGGLFELTNMVNAGSLLETLSGANVDLVLHGHEHEHNFASYSSLKPGAGAVRVVAAGSATGNRTRGGCKIQKITFNAIILAADRSVRLGRYWRAPEEWLWEDADRIEASALRLSRLRRLHRSVNDLTSEVTKYVEFTRDRDIWVYWVYTNHLLQGDKLVQEVGNSTGRVMEPEVRASMPPSPPIVLTARSERVPDKPNVWQICAEIPETLQGSIVRLELKYGWRDGALLTREEMEQTAESRQEHGTPRSEGYEFASVWTALNLPVAAMELNVVLPQEYAPNPEGTIPEVEVFVKHEGRMVQHHQMDLRPQLRILSKGMFALSVEYPLENHRYQIAWRPVPHAEVNRLMRNADRTKRFDNFVRYGENGAKLLALFREKLKESKFPEFQSLAIYVPSSLGPLYLDRAACLSWNDDSPANCDGIPPSQILMTASQNVLARAWWGEGPFCVTHSSPEKAVLSGFLASEEAVLGVPIRLGLRAINPPPWGVVRIGMSRKEEIERLTEEDLSTILPDAATILLAGLSDLPSGDPGADT